MNRLKTDEKLEAPVKKERDMDTQMILGCSGFATIAFFVYFLAVWPFLVWLEIHRLIVFAGDFAAGFGVAAVCGAIVCRKVGLAGAAGFMGGVFTASIFLYLRIEQAFVGAVARQVPEPEYPRTLQFVAPLATILFSLLICLVFVKEESKGTERP
ncbi:MAG: hypothetical protein BGO01_18290 [Armatimonadetes bacterium 55-13]|nr:MAG: hypothetical protein BGO01_18290 [Armatimonadetes bacterium 55-13]